MDYRRYIRDIPDFPSKGIIFRDITPLLRDPVGFKSVLDEFQKRYEDKGINAVVAIESRGFIFGGAIADRLGVGFVPIRKAGKLPWETVKMDYELEYGTATIEIHKDALKPGDVVLLFDDVVATGGSLEASAKLIEHLGASVFEIAVLIELTYLNGREKLKNYNMFSLIKL
ncbi:MAG: adenine phosphoribosyltransferase [bacterium]